MIRVALAVLILGFLQVSCRTWFGVSESTDAAIAKSVGAEQTTKIKILQIEDTDPIGTLNLKLSCGEVQISNSYSSKNNNVFSEIVYTAQFKSKPLIEVGISGINKSGGEFSQMFELERSKLVKQDVLILDPNLFVEKFVVEVADQYADREMKDEVLELRAEYILNRETHTIWLGYLQKNRPLTAIVPRQTYDKKHEFFRIRMKRMNVSTGEAKVYAMKYKEIPREITIDNAWYEQANIQELELRKIKKDGARNRLNDGGQDAG